MGAGSRIAAAVAVVVVGCSQPDRQSAEPPVAAASLRLEVGHTTAGLIYGVAEPPRAESDQVPKYELYLGRDALGITAVDATYDPVTASLVWIDPGHDLWQAPVHAAPAGRRLLDRRAILGLATSRGRLAFAVRNDGPETAPFVVDLRTLKRIALDDGPGPDEVLGFSPDGADVLVLSGRTGLASTFALGVDSGRVRQLTNIGLRPRRNLPAPPVAPAGADTVAFRFPGSDEHRQYFYITAYRDNSGSGNGLQDWNCGSDTYDGHRGTDMGVGGFAGMDAGRDVVAAAPGTVTYVNDGVFDRCTTGDCAGGGGFGNYVRIEHADGKVTYYGHLKKFSLTVGVGDTVTCGQKIGQVGSSGHSTGPHLHFEPRVNNVSDDPFAGPCSGPTSWWVDQGAYQSLPAIMCVDAPPPHPLLAMDAAVDDLTDSHTAGDSAGIADAVLGQTITARFYVSTDAGASNSPDVIAGVDLPGDYLTVKRWEVFDNHPSNACGGDYCPNDANDNPANPAHDDPGESFELHLNAFSAGETKMVVLTLEVVAATSGAAPHAPVQLWVKNIDGSYTKTSFDAAPDNIDGFQTFNGGDLKQQLVVDTWAPGDDPDNPDLPNNPNDPDDPDQPAIVGGCSSGGSGGSGAVLVLLGAAVALRRSGGARRPRRKPARTCR